MKEVGEIFEFCRRNGYYNTTMLKNNETFKMSDKYYNQSKISCGNIR